jgi:GNAT superfamily N-acetyltransferase
MRLEVHPLTRDRWDDLVELFGRPGGSIVRGCYCMYYRKTGPRTANAPSNQAAMRALVGRGTVPGLIAYRGGRAIGWISLGPREEYLRLRRSPVSKPVDERPVWSIVCFYVDPRERGTGVSEGMLKAAVSYAREHGARLLEAYPVDKSEPSHADFMFPGSKSMFDRAGFREVARRRPQRPVVRRSLRPPRPDEPN